MNKKILILTPFFSPEIGGAEVFTEQLAKESAKWFPTSVLTYQPFRTKAPSYEEYYYSKGHLRIYRVKWLVAPSKAWRGTTLINVFLTFPRLMLKSFVLFRKERFDIIHAQGLIAGMIAVLLAKVYRCKVFLTLLALYKCQDRGR